MNELVVLAEMAGRKCAFRAQDVDSILELGAITPVPCAPDPVVGLAAMRSQALTVIDCRKAIGEDASLYPTGIRAAIVRVDGHSYALCLDAIDDVASVRDAPSDVPGGFGQAWNRVSHGMIETDRGPVLLLDVAAIVSGERAAARAA